MQICSKPRSPTRSAVSTGQCTPPACRPWVCRVPCLNRAPKAPCQAWAECLAWAQAWVGCMAAPMVRWERTSVRPMTEPSVALLRTCRLPSPSLPTSLGNSTGPSSCHPASSPRCRPSKPPNRRRWRRSRRSRRRSRRSRWSSLPSLRRTARQRPRCSPHSPPPWSRRPRRQFLPRLLTARPWQSSMPGTPPGRARSPSTCRRIIRSSR
mmetsp:Transcript_3394/g.5939  ORF Transcript_3394/g.5939 Transcript_3394/m.5939 type:complete len:209 (-) Transcript_3394:786-1412(-)